MRTALCLLLCGFAAFAQQQPVHVEPPVYVTAIDVIADVRDSAGKLPAGLTPQDFILLEDGVEKKVIGVDYLRSELGAASSSEQARTKPWQTVLYFETNLSNGSGRRQTAKELSKHVDKLVQMGTVDVIFANPRPVALLKNSRDAEAIRAALQTVAKSTGLNQIAAHRLSFKKFVQETNTMEGIKETSPYIYAYDKDEKIVKTKRDPVMDKSNMSPHVTAVEVKLVKPYIDEEIQIVNRFRKNLLTWLSNYSRYAPRTLVMVTDGYDVDPLEYYAANLNKGDELELKSYVSQSGLKDHSAKMAASLAAAGWMTVSVQGDSATDGWLDDAASSNVGRVHTYNFSQPQAGPKSIFYRPAEPLRQVADETGGEVVGNSGKIARAMEKLDERLRVTYQVDRKPDGKARKIELRTRDNKLKVNAARWAASSTSDEMAEQRALAQLPGDATFTGDLPVEATVEWTTNPARKQGTLRVVSKLPNITNATKGDFRFTLAILVPPSEAFVTNKNLEGYQLSNGEFRLRTPLDLPAATSVVVISIEDAATGLWGSSRITVQ